MVGGGHNAIGVWLGEALVLLLAGSATAQERTIYVALCGNDTWSGLTAACVAPEGPKRNIQSGINAAVDGDTVVVGDGVYQGTVSFGGRAITVRSAGGAVACILDGQGHRLAVFNHGESGAAVLQGFTLRNGSASNPYRGGAVFVQGSASPTIRECTFTSNRVGVFKNPAYGGAVYVEGGQATLSRCVFSGNSAGSAGIFSGGYGGAVAAANGGNVAIESCLFVNNTALGDTGQARGGAVYGAVVVRNCTFVGNEALSGGGAVWGGLVANSIVWGNLGSPQANSSVEFSDVQGGALGLGNISVDPRLVSVPGGNLVLSAGSPCIDAGSNFQLSPGMSLDLAGLARRQDDPATPDTGQGAWPFVDMGANEFPGLSCYANCDASTTAPVLNVADFTCFLRRFAAGQPWANCDGSTVEPTLDVYDFYCFLGRFSVGCQ